MPTYQYRCTQCATELEVVQKFTDEPLRICPTCEGSLRKVYSAVGVVFKGSGFYATDSRGSKTAATKPADTTTPAKPAPAAATESKAPSAATPASTATTAA